MIFLLKNIKYEAASALSSCTSLSYHAVRIICATDCSCIKYIFILFCCQLSIFVKNKGVILCIFTRTTPSSAQLCATDCLFVFSSFLWKDDQFFILFLWILSKSPGIPDFSHQTPPFPPVFPAVFRRLFHQACEYQTEYWLQTEYSAPKNCCHKN